MTSTSASFNAIPFCVIVILQGFNGGKSRGRDELPQPTNAAQNNNNNIDFTYFILIFSFLGLFLFFES
jgi:hypothetical protein